MATVTKFPVSPGVYSQLIDRSEFSPASPLPDFAAIQYIFAKRGTERKIKFISTHDEAIAEFGKPSIQDYKDLGYNSALRWLKGGLGAYVCRLTAPDAAKASLHMFIKIKDTWAAEAAEFDPASFYELGSPYAKDKIVYRRDLTSMREFFVAIDDIASNEETAFNETGKWSQIHKYYAGTDYVTGDKVVVENEDDLQAIVYTALKDSPGTPSETSADWKVELKVADLNRIINVRFSNSNVPEANEIYLATFEANGSGSDYNGMFMTLHADRNYTYNNDGYPTYSFAIHDYDELGNSYQVENESGAFTFNRYTDAWGDSTFIGDILESYSKVFNFHTKESEITDAQRDEIFDEVCGRLISEKDRGDIMNIFKVPMSDEVVSTKLVIDGGNEGSLFVDGHIDADLRNELIKDFYMGLIDEQILNKHATPGGWTFDMQGSLDVSYVINDFTKVLRNDVFVFHGGKDLPNPQAEIDYRYRDFNVDNRNASLRVGYCDTIDEYTGNVVRVPMFFNKIMDLAYMIDQQGICNVFGGYDGRGNIPRIKRDSERYRASKDYLDRGYLASINLIDWQIDGAYWVSTRTLQKKNSKLSMEHVNWTQNRIMFEAELIGRRFIDKFIIPSVLKDIEQTYQEWFKNKWVVLDGIEYVKVRTEVNDFMKKNNMVSAVFEISFANIIEKLVLVHVIV